MKFYKKFFASKYDTFTKSLDRDLSIYREKLIQPLEGKILDVGSGTGANFSYFNTNAEVIAIEPSEFMITESKAKFSALKHIRILKLGINDERVSEIIEPNSLDFIVCTLVLCTVSLPQEALTNFLKWLKPSGKLVVLEHIHAEKRTNRFFQNIINPLWRIAGEGCNLNRNTDVLLKQSSFQLDREEYFKNTLRFYAAVYRNKK